MLAASRIFLEKTGETSIIPVFPERYWNNGWKTVIFQPIARFSGSKNMQCSVGFGASTVGSHGGNVEVVPLLCFAYYWKMRCQSCHCFAILRRSPVGALKPRYVTRDVIYWRARGCARAMRSRIFAHTKERKNKNMIAKQQIDDGINIFIYLIHCFTYYI